jgi:hypothetical protein
MSCAQKFHGNELFGKHNRVSVLIKPPDYGKIPACGRRERDIKISGWSLL